LNQSNLAQHLPALPSVPVLDRYTRGWPGSKQWRPIDAVRVMSLDVALTTPFDFDAHTVGYEATVSYRATSQLLDGRGRVQMVLLVVDVDAPEHAEPNALWRRAEREKRNALWTRAPGFVTYDTAGGYRLLWRLSQHLPIGTPADAELWSRLYVAWLAWIERETGIVADRNCKDWTHLFRLPLVRRDRVDQRPQLEGDLRAGVWDVVRGSDAVANDVTPARYTVIDESDGEPAPAEVSNALLDRIVAELAAAGRWDDGRQAYFLPLAGWMLGKGWARSELEKLVERMTSKHHTYRLAVKRARTLDGPPRGLQELLPPESWARLDATVNEHPNVNSVGKAMAQQAAVAAVAAMSAPTSPLSSVPAAGSAPKPKPARQPKEVKIAEVVDAFHEGEWQGVLGFDALANRVMCLRQPPMRISDDPGASVVGEWTDAHTARARTWMFERLKREPGKEVTDAAVEIVARRHAYHPVQRYLASLRWDGVPRLDSLLPVYFGAEANEYTRQVGSKTLIAAVARATRPGCKVDTMLILEGAQGIGKSRAVRALAGDDWFADTPLDLESKDAAQCLQGKWLYEIGELHSFNRTETTRIKAFVSSQSDNLRPSYGRRNQDFPRQCIFIGTTNGTEYLSDTTGNRRYWPVRCRAVDVAGLRRDRDQLWAEAAARYAAGEPWWLEGEEVALAEAQQADREAVDPWAAQLADWLEPQPAPGVPRSAPRDHFTMAEVLTGALRLGIGEQSQAIATRVGKLLAKLGWRSKAVKEHGKVVRLYVRA
jgi:hypothetical protein